jgi:arginyl-tRNA synthetase
VDPKKTMLFNPQESIDFNGNTGPFIQYTHARIKSVVRKAGEWKLPESDQLSLNAHEINLLRNLYEFPAVVEQAGAENSPALIANYAYELAREYNQFYHEVSILRETDEALRSFRIALSAFTANAIKKSMELLGIEVPERM